MKIFSHFSMSVCLWITYLQVDDNSSSDSEGAEDLSSAYKKLKWLRAHNDFKHLVSKEKALGRGASSKDKLSLNINPDFTGTFLMAPQHFDYRKDTIGLWPSKVIFPRAKESYNPTKSDCNLSNAPVWPRRLPIKFQDAKIEEFLTAGQLTNKNKAHLDLSVHALGSVELSPYENFSVQDKILRNGLIDNSITDTLIEGSNVRLQAFHDNWDYVLDLIKKGEIDFKGELKYLMEIGGLAFASNQRNRNDVAAAVTNNKIQLREKVLYKTSGSAQTKEKLKLSNLASPAIFGELPESFMRTLNASAGNPYNQLVLKNRSFIDYKRKSQDLGYNRVAKRSRGSSQIINFSASPSVKPANSGVFQNAPRSLPPRGRGNRRRGRRSHFTKPGSH